MPKGTVLLEGTGSQAVHGGEDCAVDGEVGRAGTGVAGTRESIFPVCWMSTGLPESLLQDSFERTVPEHAAVLETAPDGTVAGSGLQGAGSGGKPFAAGLVRCEGDLSGQGPADQHILAQSGTGAGVPISLEKI